MQPVMPAHQGETPLSPLVEKKSIQQEMQAHQSIKGEEVAIMQTVVAKLTRKQLYDEIWEISASGVAKKYDIPYEVKSIEFENSHQSDSLHAGQIKHHFNVFARF